MRSFKLRPKEPLTVRFAMFACCLGGSLLLATTTVSQDADEAESAPALNPIEQSQPALKPTEQSQPALNPIEQSQPAPPQLALPDVATQPRFAPGNTPRKKRDANAIQIAPRSAAEIRSRADDASVGPPPPSRDAVIVGADDRRADDVYRQQNNTVRNQYTRQRTTAPSSPSNQAAPGRTPVVLKVFHLQYAQASEMADLLNQLLGKEGLSIVADVSGNRLLVRGEPSLATEMEALLQRLDTETARPAAETARSISDSIARNPQDLSMKSPRDVDSMRLRYRSAGQQAERAAQQYRSAAGGGSSTKQLAELIKDLEKVVRQTFEARQQLQIEEMRVLRQRLENVEQRLASREKLMDLIISQRVKELTHSTPAEGHDSFRSSKPGNNRQTPPFRRSTNSVIPSHGEDADDNVVPSRGRNSGASSYQPAKPFREEAGPNGAAPATSALRIGASHRLSEPVGYLQRNADILQTIETLQGQIGKEMDAAAHKAVATKLKRATGIRAALQREFAAALQTAQADKQAADTKLRLAESELARIDGLSKRGLVSRRAAEVAQAHLDTAKQYYLAAQKKLSLYASVSEHINPRETTYEHGEEAAPRANRRSREPSIGESESGEESLSEPEAAPKTRRIVPTPLPTPAFKASPTGPSDGVSINPLKILIRGRVTEVHDQRRVKVSVGADDGVRVGQQVVIYRGEHLVAEGHVTRGASDQTDVRIDARRAQFQIKAGDEVVAVLRPDRLAPGIEAGPEPEATPEAGTEVGSDAAADAATKAGTDVGTEAGTDAATEAGTEAEATPKLR